MSSRGKTYKHFKEQLIFEKYKHIIPEMFWRLIIKFRTSNHYLPVETGRWNNIVVEDKLCTLCEESDIGDEFHNLFVCKVYTSLLLYKSKHLHI